MREAVQSGRADFVPVFLSEVPRLLASPRSRVAVALVQVAPRRNGDVSLGVSVDVVRAAIDAASLVIAEVNPHMPRTRGESFVHVDRFDALVPVDYELPEAAIAPLDDVSRAIGRNVATLVPDGATLQLGIGGVPDAVLAALEGRHDLGVHSEMISDGVMRLARAGVINGSRKTPSTREDRHLVHPRLARALPLGRRQSDARAPPQRRHQPPGDHRRATTR